MFVIIVASLIELDELHSARVSQLRLRHSARDLALRERRGF